MNDSTNPIDPRPQPSLEEPYAHGDNIGIASTIPEVPFVPQKPLTEYEKFYNHNVDPQLPVSDGRWEAALLELGFPEGYEPSKEEIEARLEARDAAATTSTQSESVSTLQPEAPLPTPAPQPEASPMAPESVVVPQPEVAPPAPIPQPEVTPMTPESLPQPAETLPTPLPSPEPQPEAPLLTPEQNAANLAELSKQATDLAVGIEKPTV